MLLEPPKLREGLLEDPKLRDGLLLSRLDPKSREGLLLPKLREGLLPEDSKLRVEPFVEGRVMERESLPKEREPLPTRSPPMVRGPLVPN